MAGTDWDTIQIDDTGAFLELYRPGLGQNGIFIDHIVPLAGTGADYLRVYRVRTVTGEDRAGTEVAMVQCTNLPQANDRVSIKIDNTFDPSIDEQLGLRAVPATGLSFEFDIAGGALTATNDELVLIGATILESMENLFYHMRERILRQNLPVEIWFDGVDTIVVQSLAPIDTVLLSTSAAARFAIATVRDGTNPPNAADLVASIPLGARNSINVELMLMEGCFLQCSGQGTAAQVFYRQHCSSPRLSGFAHELLPPFPRDLEIRQYHYDFSDFGVRFDAEWTKVETHGTVTTIPFGTPRLTSLLAEEGFEGAGAPIGWSATTTHGTVDWDQVAGAIAGSQSLQLTWTNAGDPDAQLYCTSPAFTVDESAEYTSVKFAFNIDAAFTLDDLSAARIFEFQGSAGSAGYLYVQRNAANWRLGMRKYEPSLAVSALFGSLSLGTTYYVEVRQYHNTTSGGLQCRVFSDSAYLTPVEALNLDALNGWDESRAIINIKPGSTSAGTINVSGSILFDSVRVDDVYYDDPYGGVEIDWLNAGDPDTQAYAQLAHQALTVAPTYRRYRFSVEVDAGYSHDDATYMTLSGFAVGGGTKVTVYLSRSGANYSLGMYKDGDPDINTGANYVTFGVTYYFEVRIYPDAVSGYPQLRVYSDASYQTEIPGLRLTQAAGWGYSIAVNGFRFGDNGNQARNPDGAIRFGPLTIEDIFIYDE